MFLRLTPRMLLTGRLMALVVTVMLVLGTAMSASAQAVCDRPGEGDSKSKCTCFSNLAPKINGDPNGFLGETTDYIKTIINDASQAIFHAFTNSAEYSRVVAAAATLMVIIYAAGFMIGIVQATFGQIFKRLFTMGVIFALISPDGWTFFSQYAVRFFNDGTDQLIGIMLGIGSGTPYTPGSSPFTALDGIASYMFTPDMVVAIIGSITAGPFGLAMSAFLGAAIFGLLKLVLTGLRYYAVSYLLRALLLGLAPVFIVFLLFEKTKPMFASWVNLMVNLSLKPILFFAFISFFVILLQGATRDILGGHEICWTETAGTTSGQANKQQKWSFTLAQPGGMTNFANIAGDDWFGPKVGNCLTGAASCPDFPLDIMNVLTFLILIFVAMKFSDVVDNIANDISNAMSNLSETGKMDLRREEGRMAGGSSSGGGGSSMFSGMGGQTRR